MQHIENGFIFNPDIQTPRPRRKEILLKYPEVISLFGQEKKTKYIVLGLIFSSLILASGAS